MKQFFSGSELITQERMRQINEEGWTPEHDDSHFSDELATAGALYALPERQREYYIPRLRKCPVLFPWVSEWWKPVPENRIRELVKSGALIAAEIDRLIRLRSKETEHLKDQFIKEDDPIGSADVLVEQLKKDFSGSSDYLSGVNDGMYHLLRRLERIEKLGIAVFKKLNVNSEQIDTAPTVKDELMKFMKWWACDTSPIGTPLEKVIDRYLSSTANQPKENV